MSPEAESALNAIRDTFARNREQLDQLPMTGWVLQYDNGLAMRYAGDDKPGVCGLMFATIWQQRPTTWPDFRNGNGERPTMKPIAEARQQSLDQQDQCIADMIARWPTEIDQ